MNNFQANFVKYLRVKCGGSWRWVAGKWEERYVDNTPFKFESTIRGNQLVGLELCNKAMKMLNEKVEDGWN